MESTELCEILVRTLNADNVERSKAEARLEEVSVESWFVPSLISTIGNLSIDENLRMIAATSLKNTIKKRRKINIEEELVKADEYVHFWNNIVELIVRNSRNNTVRAQLLASLQVMLDYDVSNGNIGIIFEKGYSLLESSDTQAVYSGLLILHAVLKTLRWFGQNDDEKRDEFAARVIPKLIIVSEELLLHSGDEVGEFLKISLKIYFLIISRCTKPVVYSQESLARWCNVISNVISREIPEASSPDPANANPWWKAKKWAYKAINHLIKRSNMKNCKVQGFREAFKAEFSGKLYKLVDTHFSYIICGSYVTDKVKQQMAIFFSNCVYTKSTWILMKPKIMEYIERFILPLLSFNSELEELWEDDPNEFIMERLESTFGEYFTPSSAAEKFLMVLARERFDQTFFTIMSYINDFLKQTLGPDYDMETARRKYGIMLMISRLAPLSFKKNSRVKDEMEQFVMTYIVPEMNSKYAFIRSAALEALSKFEDIKWRDEKAMIHAANTVISNFAHPNIQVKVFASFALRSIMENYAVMNECIRPMAHQLMQVLQQLANSIDLEELTEVIEILAANFADELVPFITSLVTDLVTSINGLMNEYIQIADDDVTEHGGESCEKITMIQSNIKTISTYIMIMKEYREIVHKIFIIVTPVVCFILENEITDICDDIFELLEVIAYCMGCIPPALWGFFPHVVSLVAKDPEDRIGSAINTLSHYINYGRDVFSQNLDHRTKIYDIVKTLLTSIEDDMVGTSMIRACELIEVMTLNLRGHMDEGVPFALELILPHLAKMDCNYKSSFLVFAQEVVVNLIYYNPKMTLDYLEGANVIQPFFYLLFNTLSRFKRVHDKKICILAIISILELPRGELPKSITQEVYIEIIRALVKVFQEYPKAVLEYKKEMLEEDSQENDHESSEDSVCANSDEDIYKDGRRGRIYESLDDDGIEDEEEEDSDWESDELCEDVYLVTEITKINPYEALSNLLSNQEVHMLISQSINDEDKKNLVNIIEEGKNHVPPEPLQ